MSYEKIGWVSGETPLSATNLNHMEEGISTIDSAVGTDAYDSTKAYSKGDYFIYNDSLCKAIADIAAGAELLSGVNYSTTTVHEELTELNSKTIKVVRYNTSSLTIAADSETNVTMSIPELLNKNLVNVYADGASPLSNLAQLFVTGFSHVANSKEIYIRIKNKYTSSLTTVLQLAFYYY